ncbi:MAG: septum formation inhibitor MinC [Mesorhizobium amorphae]|nr:MAG: septum formation inhibitor MinC [Mesorhizobium amorphae]
MRALIAMAATSKKPIRFRARSFVAFSLTPEAPLDEWLERLDGWTANSPGFFAGRPVVLDLAMLKPSPNEAKALVASLAERGIRVYAIEAGTLENAGPDLPPVLSGAKSAAPEEPKAVPEAQGGSLTIRTPVRSGQSIFHPGGDVIVLGSVGSGSEIIAGGSVHVYGALRGRVFAGAAGDGDARIFCRRNEAELMAIDGWYRTAEDMEPQSRGKPVQAYLADGVIQIAVLD